MKVAIIGNGIAGITAARHIRKNSDCEIFVISGESRYFFSRTALMYVYMGHMKFEHTQPYENWFWKKNKINLVEDWVESINVDQNHLALKTGDIIQYDKLILATGSNPAPLKLDGYNLRGVQSLYSKQDLELMQKTTKNIKKAVVVGGGLIGVEMAEMLHSKNIDVTMVVREESFWNNVLPSKESALVTSHIRSRGIDLKLNTTLEGINGSDHITSISLSNGEELPTEFLGITIGVQPNISLVEKSSIETNRGILVDEYLQTSVANIYAIGDCAELRNPPIGRKSIEPVWYSGRKMGETVASSATSKKEKYAPGLWFNSAKFFDLEYQTYGYVPNKSDDNTQHHYWENSSKELSLRIVTNLTGEVVGFNAFGIRLKQEICEDWINQGLQFTEAMERIEELNFNAEFFGALKTLLNLEQKV